MLRYALQEKLFRWGLVVPVLGSGPLLLAVAVSRAHGDPNPNPVGPGLLAGLTFWPGIIMVVVGLLRARRRSRGETGE